MHCAKLPLSETVHLLSVGSKTLCGLVIASPPLPPAAVAAHTRICKRCLRALRSIQRHRWNPFV